MNSINALWEQKNYNPQILFLTNHYIREYDLHHANISALYTQKKISLDQYNYLLSLPKIQREIAVGKMSRDKTILDAIAQGIQEARKNLFEYNHLEDNDILTIKNDAVFVIDKVCTNTIFGNYEFRCKHEYTIFMKLGRLEIYYGSLYDYQKDSDIINLDVKGINDSKLPLHQNGMLDIICTTCFKLEKSSIEDTLNYLQDMYIQYINRKLPKEYYREFNPDCGYRVNMPITGFCLLPDIDNSMIDIVDISTNLNVMRSLLQIVSMIYNRKTK